MLEFCASMLATSGPELPRDLTLLGLFPIDASMLLPFMPPRDDNGPILLGGVYCSLLWSGGFSIGGS